MKVGLNNGAWDDRCRSIDSEGKYKDAYYVNAKMNGYVYWRYNENKVFEGYHRDNLKRGEQIVINSNGDNCEYGKVGSDGKIQY